MSQRTRKKTRPKKDATATERSKCQRSKQKGPSGYPVTVSIDGEIVEWIADDDCPGEKMPNVLQRGNQAVKAAYDEFWDQVWYGRNADLNHPAGQPALARILEKYGEQNLVWTDFEWGLLSGRMSALAWVLGMEWDDSLET